MSFVIGILIITIAAAFVAAPFFTRESAPEAAAPASATKMDRQRLERQKTDAYAAIKEAEFDYRMGKLSDADFAAMREKYGMQAVQAIEALEVARTPPPQQLNAARRPTRIKFCPGCGRGVPPRANFCPACGRSLNEAVA